LRQQLAPEWHLRIGVFVGAGQEGIQTGERGPSTLLGDPSDLFVIAEVGYECASRTLPGRVSVGAFEHTGTFARFDGGSEDGTSGLYAVLEQTVNVQARPFDLFLQLGEADDSVAAITRHVGIGATAGDVIMPGRSDALGVGVSWAKLTDADGPGFTTKSEAALELFYGFDLAPGVRVKPDLQYIVDPGGDASVDNAWILTMRVTLSL
jgi:porin